MTKFTGCLPDTRSNEAKAKDWHKELATVLPLTWQTKSFEEVISFPVRDQDGSGSCVAQTIALMAGIENFLEEERFIEFSAKDIYTRRSNKDTMGMIGVEALDLWRKYGITFENLIPSQKMGEVEMNKITRKISDEEIGKIFKIKDFYQLPFNIDQIATIMESGRKSGVAKSLMAWFQFPRAEWDAKPQLTNSTSDIVHHSVTIRERGVVDNKKGVFIQDSWGLHTSTINGLRFISEEYINKRMTFCAYVNDLENDWQDGQTSGTIINRVLKIGCRGDDVKELQRLLGITQDGIFGPGTWQAVRVFQKQNGLLVDGVVGLQTLKALLK